MWKSLCLSDMHIFTQTWNHRDARITLLSSIHTNIKLPTRSDWFCIPSIFTISPFVSILISNFSLAMKLSLPFRPNIVMCFSIYSCKFPGFLCHFAYHSLFVFLHLFLVSPLLDASNLTPLAISNMRLNSAWYLVHGKHLIIICRIYW